MNYLEVWIQYRNRWVEMGFFDRDNSFWVSKFVDDSTYPFLQIVGIEKGLFVKEKRWGKSTDLLRS